jgi:SAM-dependent methyltransferase
MNPALRVAARLSEPARLRYAGDVFETGRGRLRDRVVSTAYFAMSTAVWRDRAVDAAHLAPFTAGIAALDAAGASPRLVVDVGTGAGASAAITARHWPDATVEGIDSSWAMLRRARRLHAEPNLRFRRASAVAMPYADHSVDLVTCLNAIVVPSEMQRVCAPGGFVLAAATWVGLREESSDWVQRFAAAGCVRVDAGRTDAGGSWELYALR